MKKLIPFIMLSGIIALSACGNKTADHGTQQDSTTTTDSVAVVDSVANDTLTTEPKEEEVSEKKEEVKATAKSIEAGGTTITVGAPLAETLRKAKKVTFDYSGDFGVSASIDGILIYIPDEDITKEGMDFVNAILSDIEPDIDFKISYIKPSAKIKDFVKN